MTKLSLTRRSMIKTFAATAVTAGGSIFSVAGAADSAAPSFDKDTDVLVIGGGLSGIGAAIMAARSGAKVCLLEQRGLLGGDGILSEGVFHSSKSVVHKKQGFTDKDKISFEDYWDEQSRGVMDDDVMNNVRDNTTLSPIYNAYNKRNLDVMKNVARNCTNAIALLDSYGVKFKPIDPQLRFLQCVQRGQMNVFFKKALEECKQRNIDVICNIRALKLITGKDGGVDGVEAEYVRGPHKGEKLFVKAKRTILATGGFLDNEA